MQTHNIPFDSANSTITARCEYCDMPFESERKKGNLAMPAHKRCPQHRTPERKERVRSSKELGRFQDVAKKVAKKKTAARKKK